MDKTYSVLIIDNYHMDPKYDFQIDGFPNLELATEFAKRWTRDSLEELREPNQTVEQLREKWYMFGEDAIVLDGDYKGSSDIDFFIWKCQPVCRQAENTPRVSVGMNWHNLNNNFLAEKIPRSSERGASLAILPHLKNVIGIPSKSKQELSNVFTNESNHYFIVFHCVRFKYFCG